MKKHIDSTCEAYSLTQVIIGIEKTTHYYKDLVRQCMNGVYVVRLLNAETTAREREIVLNYMETDPNDISTIKSDS